MSESTKPESKADELTKTTDKANIELNEEELGSVSGGVGTFVKIEAPTKL
jgi:hypothetical protein